MPDSIAPDIFRSAVQGLNLTEGGGTLADQIGDRPTLLVFLRHFGCQFCREMVHDLRQIAGELAAYPPVLFFFMGTVEEGRTFFEQHWPEARAVADEAKAFYTAFGVRRATFGQMFGIQVWTCRLRALSKGNFVGRAVGDPWIMPGAFLVHASDVLWSHLFQHQGDRPDWRTIPSHVPATAH
jgi:peroxiredoxin